MRKHNWEDIESGEAVTTSEDNKHWDSDPMCPVCGDLAAYEEFQTGQDIMGNDYYGWHWACRPCGIATATQELEDDDDEEW
jgi:hypothetical protein